MKNKSREQKDSRLGSVSSSTPNAQRIKEFIQCLGNGAGSEQASYERDTR